MPLLRHLGCKSLSRNYVKWVSTLVKKRSFRKMFTLKLMMEIKQRLWYQFQKRMMSKYRDTRRLLIMEPVTKSVHQNSGHSVHTVCNYCQKESFSRSSNDCTYLQSLQYGTLPSTTVTMVTCTMQKTRHPCQQTTSQNHAQHEIISNQTSLYVQISMWSWFQSPL